MISFAVPRESQALVDEVDKALDRRGARPAAEVLDDLGVASLMAEGGTLFDAALVAEAAGRHGLIAWPEERVLVAAACLGMARRALDDAAAYACERVVFGRPIGEYQGVSHRLADHVTHVEGARLLVWRAVAARSEDPGQAGRLELQAWWWAARACMPAIRFAMRTFGGYGVSEDSPLPDLYRTACAALLAPGDPDRILTGPLPEVARGGEVPVSFTMDAEAEEWAARTRRFLADHFTPADKQAFFASPDNHLPALHRALGEAGLLFPEWPVEWGGSGIGPWAGSAVHRELSLAGWPISVMTVSDTIGKLLMRFGTPEAQAEILPRLASGEAIGCLGMSEPSGGSDVFGARTRAVHDGAQWIAEGQKIFTTSAHAAEYVLLLTRTGGGLTLFVAPLGEGFDLAPVHTLAGERTNITYYSGFAIPDRYLLGEVDRGVKVLAATLTMEHSAGDYFTGAMLAGQKELAEALPELLALPGMAENEQAIRLSLARFDAHVAMLECLSWRAIWAGHEGVGQRWYGPMCKLFGSESWSSCFAELVERFAPHALAGAHPALALVEKEARSGLQSTIYGGTSEIQRSIIAETALGLPRTR